MKIIQEHQKIINDIYKNNKGNISDFRKILIPDREFYFSNGDGILVGQRMTKRILDYLGIHSGQIVVSFAGNMSNPGVITRDHAGNFFIELATEYKEDPVSIGCILSHEVTHMYMALHNIEYSNVDENEIATDITSILLGFGITVLNGYRVEKKGKSFYKKYKRPKTNLWIFIS